MASVSKLIQERLPVEDTKLQLRLATAPRLVQYSLTSYQQGK